MTESAQFTQLQELSTALASLVTSIAPSVTTVPSHRSRSSGFVWRPGLIVTADEALSEDGEFAVSDAPRPPRLWTAVEYGLPGELRHHLVSEAESTSACTCPSGQ